MQNISADVYIGQEFLPIMAELRKTCQVAMTDAVDPSKLLTMLKGRFGHILMLTHAQKRRDQLHIIKFSYFCYKGVTITDIHIDGA